MTVTNHYFLYPWIRLLSWLIDLFYKTLENSEKWLSRPEAEPIRSKQNKYESVYTRTRLEWFIKYQNSFFWLPNPIINALSNRCSSLSAFKDGDKDLNWQYHIFIACLLVPTRFNLKYWVRSELIIKGFLMFFLHKSKFSLTYFLSLETWLEFKKKKKVFGVWTKLWDMFLVLKKWQHGSL